MSIHAPSGSVRPPHSCRDRTAPKFAPTSWSGMSTGVIVGRAAPMAVTDPGGLVVVGERGGTRTVSVSYPNFLDWQERVTSLSSMAAYQPDTATMRNGSSAARLRTYRVSRDWMATLGVSPTLGRAFTDADHSAGAPLTVLLSHTTWTHLFGADTGVIGRPVVIDDLPHSWRTTIPTPIPA